MPNEFVEYAGNLTNLTQSVLTAVDPERRDTEAQRIIADLLDKYPFLPETEQQRARQKYIAEQDRIAGERLHQLITLIREDLDIFAVVQAHSKLPPTALQVFEQRYGSSTRDQALQVGLLEEARIARYTRELAGARPTTVLDAYAAAVNNGSDDADSVIRFIEERLPRTWEGAPRAPEDAVAVQQLARAIAKQQEARVAQTPGLTAWGEALAAARKAVTAARDLHRVQPRPPQRAISEETIKAVDHVRTTRLAPTRKAKAS